MRSRERDVVMMEEAKWMRRGGVLNEDRVRQAGWFGNAVSRSVILSVHAC